ncbi:MAG TPA: TonB-dependent receptor plug domain-containing protein, partial [Caulobacteraceae bacterium]|nr:TonB-dependent receptor plug domain-containing protein [Caulobacteraceae bacterium]
MASAAAVAVFAANSALAQQNPPKKPAASSAAADADKTDDNTTEVESVVVTGTFLRGTPETATIPVEGYNLEQIRNQGSPSNMDFVKNLSEIGQVFGESNRAATLGNGQQTINLRSLGASRTVVVFNGRRLNEEYSFGLGRSNNIATIPSCAIGRVEVLKDGGGTTYGADAVGGVVNYITRRNFEGLEAQAQYRYIDGSNGGDYSTCITYGKRFDKGNFQISVGYNHRSILPVLERDWAFVPYLKNPGSWSGDSNPGSYQLVNSIGGPFGNQPITPGGPVSAVSGGLVALFGATVGGQMAADLRYPTTTDLQVGTAGGIRDPNCTAMGGFAGWTGFGQGAQPMCYFANGLQENLVEESDIVQGYAEGNWQFSNKFKVHAEYTLYWLDLPRIPLDVFTALVQAYPMQRDKFGNVVTTTTNGQVIAQSQTISTV